MNLEEVKDKKDEEEEEEKKKEDDEKYEKEEEEREKYEAKEKDEVEEDEHEEDEGEMEEEEESEEKTEPRKRERINATENEDSSETDSDCCDGLYLEFQNRVEAYKSSEEEGEEEEDEEEDVEEKEGGKEEKEEDEDAVVNPTMDQGEYMEEDEYEPNPKKPKIDDRCIRVCLYKELLKLETIIDYEESRLAREETIPLQKLIDTQKLTKKDFIKKQNSKLEDCDYLSLDQLKSEQQIESVFKQERKEIVDRNESRRKSLWNTRKRFESLEAQVFNSLQKEKKTNDVHNSVHNA